MGTTIALQPIQFKRGTTAKHAVYTGADGEVTVNKDKKALVVHDGITPGGSAMVPEARTINGYSLATNVALTANDVGAVPTGVILDLGTL